MSYDISLHDAEGKIVEVERHTEGGTIVVGGTTSADMNVTYNYGEVYHLFGFSLKDLGGQKASDTIARLRELVDKLGTRTFENYWAPTPGNAGHALFILLKWAEQHPDSVWQVH